MTRIIIPTPFDKISRRVPGNMRPKVQAQAGVIHPGSTLDHASGNIPRPQDIQRAPSQEPL